MQTRARATIYLNQLAANWRALAAWSPAGETGAVVKANAYGHGLSRSARALAEAGCGAFFVAHASEGAALRDALDGLDADIHVFHGACEGEAALCRDKRLIPVINSMEQARVWRAEGLDAAGPATLHVDTGMNRLGLRPNEVEAVRAMIGDGVGLVMSHFACADEPNHPLNKVQIERFEALCSAWPKARRSMANSAGVYLGATYDLTRPGVALYGGGPPPPAGLVLQPVMTLDAPVVSVFRAEAGASTGYGATRRFGASHRLATLAFGYADGLPRAASNSGYFSLGGVRCPIVGRVSMDLVTVDVSAVDSPVAPGVMVEYFGAEIGLEAQAAAAKTLGYELLTGIGERVERIWRS